MAKELSQMEIAIQRIENQGKIVKSFKDAGFGAVRALDINPMVEGKVYEIPENYTIGILTIPGTTREFAVVVATDGTQIPVGCLTRSAQPADGGERVMPKGTVVETCQKYGSMDEFWKNEMAGKKFKATKKEAVVANAFDGEGTTIINVWTLDFVA